MRLLFAVVATFASLCAFAGPDPLPCHPLGSSAYHLKVNLQPTANVSQWVRNAGAYYVVSVWCLGKYTNKGRWWIGTYADMQAAVPNWFGEIQKVPFSSLTDIQAAQVRYQTKTPSPEQVEAGMAQLMGDKPPQPVWKIAVYGTAKDRPVYPVVNGLRGTTAIKLLRYKVGDECACDSLVIEENGSPFCPLRANPVDLKKVSRCGQ